MSCLGVHFAIEQSMVDRLLAASESERKVIVQEEIEQAWDKRWLVETDKAWDAIHRCLTDGGLEWGKVDDPKSNAVLSGNVLYTPDDYIICLVPSWQVEAVAESIRVINRDALREAYFRIDPDEYGVNLDEEDFSYTWANFSQLPQFFTQAAEDGRAVLFTADQ